MIVCHLQVQLPMCSTQVSAIEFSLVEQSVLHGLQQGNVILSQIHKEMNLESVERLLADTQEARAYQEASPLRHVQQVSTKLPVL